MICVAASSVAQQANQNINVLPVYFNEQDDPINFPIDLDAHLKGDLFLQRQVEPTIASSSRNPLHLLAFFVDYRAVDIPDDEGIGQSATDDAILQAETDANIEEQFDLPPQVAAAEAWIGGGRSYDGGVTWSGFFLPGAPFDNSPASQSAPIQGLEAATDPVAASAPCGIVYVALVAFTRGGESQMVVAKYEDLNNDEGGDTWVYRGMSVLEVGNNADNGFFIDKPFLLVDPKRGGSGDSCDHNVYVSYSTFNGFSGGGKFRSKVTFARSLDGGANFDVQKLNAPFHQNQGTWMAVDPRPGTPNTTGGGTVYLFWRHFFDPEGILMIRSLNFGKTFPGNPDVITGDIPIAAFDQPSLPTIAVANPITDIAFRSNGFPTATASGDGTVFVAWQERVDIDPASPNFGLPDVLGSPRVVLMRSTDDGDTWSDADGISGQRRAIDFGDRDDPADPNLPEPGFGALPQSRPSGPQVMPALSCGGGRCILIYYESRGFIGVDPITQREVIQPADLSVTTDFISGIDRMMDLRAALLHPVTGSLLSTTQVSRYTIRAGADLTDGEDLEDIDPVNSPCLPDDGSASVRCERRVHRSHKPQSGAGTTPFIGDYTFAIPISSLVPTDDQTGWRWATDAADVPYQGFHAIWADNRNLIPPTVPAEQPEWMRYQTYGPPSVGGACLNSGARNTDTLTARIDAELILSAPTSYKQLDSRRSFPLSLMNATGVDRFYRLTITTGADRASFSMQEGEDIDTGDVPIFPYSSISQMVYVEPGPDGPIQVAVQEIDGIAGNLVPGGQSGSVTFNLDSSNPTISDLGALETFDPAIVTTEVTNPFAINPFAINTSPSNPFAINPFAINPFAINSTIYDVVDTTWTVTGGDSNTTSSYLPLVNIDNLEAFLSSYSFQLLIYKTSAYGALNTAACESYNVSQDQIISNIVLDPENPFAINPFAINPFAINPFAINPFAINSAFTMAPTDSGTGSGFASQSAALTFDDGTTKAPRAPEVVKVLLRAFQTEENPDFVFDPTEDPPSLAVVPLACDPQAPAPGCNIVSTAPDLVPVGVGQPDPVVGIGDTLMFPPGGWTLQNQGNNDATAENRDLRHGIYLSADAAVDLSFAGEPINGDILLGFQASTANVLAPGGDENFSESELVIPADTPVGDYYLILFVDDFTEVSEVDEVNNAVAFSITLEDPNTPPVAEDGSFVTDEDTILEGFLVAPDAQGDLLSFAIVDSATQGTATIVDTSTGEFSYSPDADANGSDTFTFRVNDGELDSNTATISVTINAVNDAPVATEGLIFGATEDTLLNGQLTAQDIDGDTLTFSVTTNGSLGTATVVDALAGSFTYLPNPNANGSDSFSFQASDGQLLSAATTVVVTVTSVNDAPVAQNGALSTAEDTPANGTLAATDVDGDPLTFSLVQDGALGAVTITDALSGAYRYVPGSDANGSDTFTFRAGDGQLDSNLGTISVTIGAVNDAPVATEGLIFGATEDTLLNGQLTAQDIDGDTLTFSVATNGSLGTATVVDALAGSFTYLPNPNANGSDSFSFQASDGQLLSAATTVVVTVTSVNDAPVAQNGALSTAEDTPANGSLAATDVDGDPLTFSLVQDGALGAVTITDELSGAYQYVPGPDANGSDTFTFRVNDGELDSNTATISVTINAVNDAPAAQPDTVTSAENDSVTFDPIANDLDKEGHPLVLFSVDDPTNGTVTSAGNLVTYVPDPNFVGTDAFSYEIQDLLGATATGSITVNVLDDVADFGFIGLQSPWTEPPPIAAIKAGRSFPLAWQYTDPVSGVVVESSGALPEVRIKGPFSCNGGETSSTLEAVNFPGNSGFQYVAGSDTHQFNWNTDGLQPDCYNIRIFSQLTRQLNGPFLIRLRK